MLLLGDSSNPFTMILGFGHEPSEVTKKLPVLNHWHTGRIESVCPVDHQTLVLNHSHTGRQPDQLDPLESCPEAKGQWQQPTGCVAGISGGWFLTAYLQPPIWLRCHLRVQFHRQAHSVLALAGSCLICHLFPSNVVPWTKRPLVKSEAKTPGNWEIFTIMHQRYQIWLDEY